MVYVNTDPVEIEVVSRAGDRIRADVCLPSAENGPFPVPLAASAYQKALLRRLPAHPVFPFIEYGPVQLYLDHGYAYVAMDVPGTGRSEGTWDPVPRGEGEAIHDMIEHGAECGTEGGDPPRRPPGQGDPPRLRTTPVPSPARARQRSHWRDAAEARCDKFGVAVHRSNPGR
jgi:hypothetical protein